MQDGSGPMLGMAACSKSAHDACTLIYGGQSWLLCIYNVVGMVVVAIT